MRFPFARHFKVSRKVSRKIPRGHFTIGGTLRDTLGACALVTEMSVFTVSRPVDRNASHARRCGPTDRATFGASGSIREQPPFGVGPASPRFGLGVSINKEKPIYAIYPSR